MLKRRMGNFGLSLEEEKSRLIEFGRFAQENAKKRGKKAETFDFLGFTHYCSTGRNGKFKVRKTSRKKFRKKCREMNGPIREMRCVPMKELIKKLNQILVGYYHYYGITDNSEKLREFQYRVKRLLYYWLNRRSQRKSYTWERFGEMLKTYSLAEPRIYVSVYRNSC